mgnify:CR=1 FL=1
MSALNTDWRSMDMGQAMTEREIESVLREVTDEEVAFYQEYGWVMMKQLVDPAFATELLRVGQVWRESKQEKGPFVYVQRSQGVD